MIGFSVKSFRSAFLQFCNTTVKVLILGGQLDNSGQKILDKFFNLREKYLGVKSISKIFLKLANFLWGNFHIHFILVTNLFYFPYGDVQT